MKMQLHGQRILYIAGFLALIAALAGPWPVYDQINVPAQYTCSAPFVRLNGDFCGTPLSGLYLISMMGLSLVSPFIRIAMGTDSIVRLIDVILSLLIFIIIISPLVTTSFLAAGRSTQKLHMIHLLGAGAAGIACIVFATTNFPQYYSLVWGIWLYSSITAALILVEILSKKKTQRNLVKHPQEVG